MAELAWPEDLGHGTFVGRFGFMDADSHDPDREPDITSATGGTVTITPSIRSVRYSGAQGPMILAARPAKGVIDSEGYLCTAAEDGSAGDRGMVFPATDDTDLNPTDWTYEVSIILDGQVRIGTFNVKLPAGETVDLSLAAPVPSSGGTAIVVDPTTAIRAEAAADRAESAATEAEDYAPTFVWDGTRLVVDGETGPDLKGEQGTTAWADLTGKPDTYPSTIPEVDGLAARLAALERDTGVRNIGSLFINGWTAYGYTATLQRIGPWCEIRAYVSHMDATDDRLIDLPPGFRPGYYSRPVGTIFGTSTTEARAFTVSPDNITIVRSRFSQSQNMIHATWITRDAWPDPLPGDPA